ncbi:MAG: tRNA (adenosine(37)-N6)-threonylcarbamoyltransferase complex ATPase subunit type 1 TsaE [Bacteroidetes bacterium]|nr:tRNA (adenosine(37)-N6)-threonylcarbamoyltransferase complex ATPase subunit type 1 TsaE [Bacteroidota bacterium]
MAAIELWRPGQTVRSRSPEETARAGSTLSTLLNPGDIVALHGDLGAGKTEFVRGVCSGLGIDPRVVNSPTFAIVNEYRGGSVPVFHLDVYRIKHLDELVELGYEDYFFGDGICLVEWPSHIEELLPERTILVSIAIDGSDRVIELRNIR